MAIESDGLDWEGEVSKRVGLIVDGEEFLREIDGIVAELLEVLRPSEEAMRHYNTKDGHKGRILWYIAKGMRIEAFSADVWRWWRSNTKMVKVFGGRVANEPSIGKKLSKDLEGILEEVVFENNGISSEEKGVLDWLFRQGKVKFSKDQRFRLWDNIRNKKQDLGSPYSLWILNDPNSTNEELLEVAKIDCPTLVWAKDLFFKEREERFGEVVDWLIDNVDYKEDEIIARFLIQSPLTDEKRLNRLMARIKDYNIFADSLVTRSEVYWARLGAKIFLRSNPNEEVLEISEDKWVEILGGLNEKDELLRIMLVHKSRAIRERAIKTLSRIKTKDPKSGPRLG